MAKAKINIQLNSDSQNSFHSQTVEIDGNGIDVLSLLCGAYEKSDSFYQLMKTSVEQYPQLKARLDASRNQN